MYPVTIDGYQVTLRELHGSDLESTMSVVGDPEVTRYLSFDPRTLEQQAQALDDIIRRARAIPREDYYLAIAAKHRIDFIGLIRIRTMYNRAGQLGYGIRRDRWSEGYATEAIVCMLDFAFDTLGLHRIEATYRHENVRSASLLKRLGFTLEGRLRDHAFTGGQWRESVLSSILEDEWRQRKPDLLWGGRNPPLAGSDRHAKHVPTQGQAAPTTRATRSNG